MTTKKEKLFINFVLSVFIAGILCCFTLYPILCDTVSAEELTNNSVLNFNQLVNYDNIDGRSIYGLSATSTFTGILVTGTKSSTSNSYWIINNVNLVPQHKYIVLNPDSGSYSSYIEVYDSVYIQYSNQIFLVNSILDKVFFNVRIPNGIVVNSYFHLNIIDLTQCFGAGNEPTSVAEFKSYFNNDYYAYTTSTLVPLNATTSYSQGYTDGIKSFSVVTAADDIYNSSYYLNNSVTDILAVNDNAPYFVKLVPNTDLKDYLVFPMNTTIPSNSNFIIEGYIASYIHSYSGTLNIYSLINNSDFISIGTIKYENYLDTKFTININVPFSITNIAFDSDKLCVLGDVTVTYKINNLQKLAQDNYDAGRSSRDHDVTIAFDNGKKVGMSQANPYTFNALFGAVFDAPIHALTGLLDFDILGVNMKGLYLSLFTLALIIFIVKLCLGKV